VAAVEFLSSDVSLAMVGAHPDAVVAAVNVFVLARQ
jgi:hypothetical protein